jgi:hypothetical protein
MTDAFDPAALPTVDLDPLARLRVLSRVLDGTAMTEAVLDVPFERFWPWLSDLERSVPAFDRDVWRLRVLARDGDRWRVRAWPASLAFTVDVRPGWVWMHSPIYAVGMAAVPAGADRTRVGHLEGLPAGGPRWLQRIESPLLWLSRAYVSGHVARDVAGMARALGTRIVTP